MSVVETMMTAAGVGALGSLHCTAMCGPLAIAGCSNTQGVDLARAAHYFGGRLVSYAFAGAVFGALGEVVAHRMIGGTVSNVLLAIVAALAFLRGAIMLVRVVRPPPERLIALPRPSRARDFLSSIRPAGALALGLVTGGLPCGMLGAGWLLAAASGSAAAGAATMGAFSTATALGLLLALVVRRRAATLLRSPALQGVLWCLAGVWTGLRPALDHLHHHGMH